jgi:hypothetical protein
MVDSYPAVAADSASHQGLRQAQAEATTFFEVGRFLNGAGRLATLSENLPLCPSHLFPERPRAPPRRTRFIQVLKKQFMAVKRHRRGASSKEQRQYEHIKKSARRSGKRAKEVAARTVKKQHRKKKKSRR